jgi:hypothetical protein
LYASSAETVRTAGVANGFVTTVTPCIFANSSFVILPANSLPST